MNNTRTFNPTVVLSLAAGAILLLVIGFIAGMNLPEVSINFGELSLNQVNNPEPVTLHTSDVTAEGLAIYRQSERGFASPKANMEGLTIYRQSEHGFASPKANMEGLTIYHQSERGFALPRTNLEGMAVYHESEWGNPTAARIKQTGLETYWQSERSNAAPFLIEEGMVFYLQSERSIPLAGSGSTKDRMDIYYASERDR